MIDLGNIDEILAPIKKRLKAATPGPWRFLPADDTDDWVVYNSQFTFVKQDDAGVPVSNEDGDFIANAPTDIATLIELVEKLTTAREAGKDEAK